MAEAGGVAVEVQGGPELRRALKKAEADLNDLTKLHREIGNALAPRVGGMAPYESGELSRSFRSAPTRTKARVKSNLIYAPVQNYGWRRHNITPKKYAERAVASFTPTALGMYEKGIGEICRKVEK